MEVEDSNGDTRKSTLATLRTKMFAGGTGYTASDPLTCGAITSSGDLAINTNKFTVASASGNTAVAGTFNVTGASTLSSGQAMTRGTNVAVPNASATTIYALANLTNGTIIRVTMGATDAVVGAVVDIVVMGDTYVIKRNDATSCTISLSGSNVQMTQSNGVTIHVNYTVTREA